MANEQNFPGVSVGGDRKREREKEIIPDRDGGSGHPEINVISSAVVEKIRAQRAPSIDPLAFCATRLVRGRVIAST